MHAQRPTPPAGTRPVAKWLLVGALAVVAGLAWWWAATPTAAPPVAAAAVPGAAARASGPPVVPAASGPRALPAVTAAAAHVAPEVATLECLASLSTLGRLRAAVAGALADDSALRPLLATIETEEDRARQAGAAVHAAAVQRLRASTNPATRAAGLQVAAAPRLSSQAGCQGDDCTAALQVALQQTAAPLAMLATLAHGSTDARVYARAWAACHGAGQQPGDVPACSQLSAQRWAQLAPDTAAPWLVLAAQARSAGDVSGELNAMHRAAAAPNWRNPAGGLLRLLLAETASEPAGPLVRWHAEWDALSAELQVAGLGAPSPLRFCAPPLDANRVQICTRLATRMLEAPEDLLQLAMAITMGERVGWPAEQLAARRRERDALTTAAAGQSLALAVPGSDAALNTAALCNDLAAMRQRLARWADGGELAALRALLPAAAAAAPATLAPASAASAQAR